jgi:hypothetical protein
VFLEDKFKKDFGFPDELNVCRYWIWSSFKGMTERRKDRLPYTILYPLNSTQRTLNAGPTEVNAITKNRIFPALLKFPGTESNLDPRIKLN